MIGPVSTVGIILLVRRPASLQTPFGLLSLDGHSLDPHSLVEFDTRTARTGLSRPPDCACAMALAMNSWRVDTQETDRQFRPRRAQGLFRFVPILPCMPCKLWHLASLPSRCRAFPWTLAWRKSTLSLTQDMAKGCVKPWPAPLNSLPTTDSSRGGKFLEAGGWEWHQVCLRDGGGKQRLSPACLASKKSCRHLATAPLCTVVVRRHHSEPAGSATSSGCCHVTHLCRSLPRSAPAAHRYWMDSLDPASITVFRAGERTQIAIQCQGYCLSREELGGSQNSQLAISWVVS